MEDWGKSLSLRSRWISARAKTKDKEIEDFSKDMS